jgi:hypothetical protein
MMMCSSLRQAPAAGWHRLPSHPLDPAVGRAPVPPKPCSKMSGRRLAAEEQSVWTDVRLVSLGHPLLKAVVGNHQ